MTKRGRYGQGAGERGQKKGDKKREILTERRKEGAEKG